MKEFNVKCHYETCHSKYKEYVGQRRKLKIKNLKSGFKQQTNFFKKKQEESESVTKAALVVSSLIAKRMKPFTDAEFIKECTLAIVNEVYPEKNSCLMVFRYLPEQLLAKWKLSLKILNCNLKTNVLILIIFSSHLMKARMHAILRN